MAQQFSFTVPAGIDLGACASNDDGVGPTSQVLFIPAADSQQPIAMATNGRVLAVVPLHGSAMKESVLLPCDACKSNGKDATVDVGEEVRVKKGKVSTLHEINPDGGLFPAVKRVLVSEAEKEPFWGIVTLDVNYLMALAKSLSAERTLTLLIPKANPGHTEVSDPVFVLPRGDSPVDAATTDGIGLIMPMTSDKRFQLSPNNYLQKINNLIRQLPDGRYEVLQRPRPTAAPTPDQPAAEPTETTPGG